MTYTAYRCTRCGKWSHALRKPKQHKRFTREQPEETDVVLEYMPPSFGYEGPNADDGYLIACGPFQTYTLTPKETDR